MIKEEDERWFLGDYDGSRTRAAQAHVRKMAEMEYWTPKQRCEAGHHHYSPDDCQCIVCGIRHPAAVGDDA